MGFYATETCPAVEDLPPKNRVMGSRRSAATRARVPASEPVETASETTATVTITVSGLACWLSRDPIGDLGGVNVYAYVDNSPVDRIDPFGLFSHQGDCSNEQLDVLRRAEAEAKRRTGLWMGFLDPGPDDLEIAEYLERQFGTLIPVQNWRLVNIFNRDVKNKTAAIKAGFDGNAYGVECECRCDERTIAYTISNWLALGFDDDIHFCPTYFRQGFDDQVAYFVHEMSHYYAGTSDDYSWVQPSARLGDSVGKAQLYEDMGRSGRSAALVRVTYYTWINAAVAEARRR